MGETIFHKKYKSILNQLKKEIIKSNIELSIEQAKGVIARTIIHILDIEKEEKNHSK